MNTARTQDWAGRRVLVTGAAGFIGSHLAEALAGQGASVRAFVRYNSRNDYGWLEDIADHEQVEIFRGDLVNPEAVANALEGIDTVFHLGALIPIPYSYLHPREFVEANVVGTLNVLEAARRSSPGRLVHVSTSEVYGTPLTVPIDEDHRVHAQSPYAASKAGADQLALSYRDSFELPVVVARPFNTYGPRQSARAIVPTIVTQALSRASVDLGTLETTRDFVYVDDTVAGLIASARADGVEGEVINLGTGAETSIGALADLIFELLELERQVRFDEKRVRPAESEVERLRADAAKAERLLGWSARVELADGLARTIEWIRGALDAYKPSIYNL
jgi:NAD dependent epimerase/dehydratase